MEVDKYISQDIWDVLLDITAAYPSIVICGSVGLVLNGVLKREVHDIDILSQDDLHFANSTKVFNADSERFTVKDEITNCSYIFLNKVKVDVLKNSGKPPKYAKMYFKGRFLKVENPKYAIRFKKKYILANDNLESVLKHLADLLLLKVPVEEVLKVIQKRTPINDSKLDEHLSTEDEYNSDDLPF